MVAAPSIVLRYLSMNTQQKPFDNPKVRQAIAYAINKEALAKVAFNGYATPAEGVVPQGVEYAVKLGAMAVRRGEGQEADGRSRLSERLRDRALVGLQSHDRAKGDAVPAAAARSRSASSAKITLLEAGQRVEKVESWHDPATAPVRLYYVGWSTSTGEADWALRPLLASANPGRRGFSTPPTTRTTRSTATSRARSSRPRQARRKRSSTRTRRKRSGTMRRGRRWSPRSCSRRHNKKLTGVYVMPDASFNFTEIDLKP